MGATVIDGKALAAAAKVEAAEKVRELKNRGINPCLAVILVGENPASQVYVRGKINDCAQCGIESRSINLPADTTQDALLAELSALDRGPLPRAENIAMPRREPVRRVEHFDTTQAKLCMLFTLGQPMQPGQLAAALDQIGARGFNMECIKSRPLPHVPFEYYFYVQFVCPAGSTGAGCQTLLAPLTSVCSTLRLLGAFTLDSTEK